VDTEIIGMKECVGYVGRLGEIRTRACNEPMGIPRTAIFRVNTGIHADERMQLINFIHMRIGIKVSSVASGGRDFHSWRYLPYCVLGENIPLEYKLIRCTLTLLLPLRVSPSTWIFGHDPVTKSEHEIGTSQKQREQILLSKTKQKQKGLSTYNNIMPRQKWDASKRGK
jgi:hypothetical protein